MSSEFLFKKIMWKVLLLCYQFYLFTDVICSKEPSSTGRIIWFIVVSILALMDGINLFVYWAHWRVGYRDIEEFKPVLHPWRIVLGLFILLGDGLVDGLHNSSNRNLTPDERVKLEKTVREVQRLQTNNPYYVKQNRGRYHM